jgi:hypothetical protein
MGNLVIIDMGKFYDYLDIENPMIILKWEI